MLQHILVGAQSIHWCQVNGQNLHPSGVKDLGAMARILRQLTDRSLQFRINKRELILLF
ncbi:MAG: hypothetical protein KME17_24320 [Cyanosarcina radialis HA8281-LM2]|nr:hypothetical protein [Cyanosarcina radialis HA8281-LM2]